MEECIICFEENTDFVTFPCNHKVCVLCFPKLKRCPLCNIELIVEVQESYVNQTYPIKFICYMVVLRFILIYLPSFYLVQT